MLPYITPTIIELIYWCKLITSLANFNFDIVGRFDNFFVIIEQNYDQFNHIDLTISTPLSNIIINHTKVSVTNTPIYLN